MPDDDLRLLIQKVARRIRNNRADDALSDSQLGVLFQLESGDRSPSELAAHERVTPPSMNRTLNGLEQAGLIARTPAADDARRVRVAITDAGLTQIAETRKLRTAWFSQQLADLTPDERRALEAVIPVLRRLAQS
ncbi:MAG TPA: MarR family transcriptional regulator [Pseudolysinimonas sp.]|jgi:DNA-binding MarR family transcriptional regulator|nr:MarR family transcriptional regulator [Pseudolysinimonas sp.]